MLTNVDGRVYSLKDFAAGLALGMPVLQAVGLAAVLLSAALLGWMLARLDRVVGNLSAVCRRIADGAPLDSVEAVGAICKIDFESANSPPFGAILKIRVSAPAKPR